MSRRAASEPLTPGQLIEQEVIGNVLAQPIGAAAVADLSLPPELVRRIADRAIRSSFYDRYRIVLPDPASPPLPGPTGSNRPIPDVPGVRIVDTAQDSSIRSGRAGLGPRIPTLRGFRATLHAPFPGPFPLDAPAHTAPRELRRAADLIARGLARDGLLTAAARALHALGPSRCAGDVAGAIASLRASGLPTDLLEDFSAPNAPRGGAGVVAYLCGLLASGHSPDRLGPQVSACTFDFTPSAKGFAACAAGHGTPHLLRLQLTRGTPWLAPDDGGSLDLSTQVVHALPGVPVVLSVERSHAADFLDRAAAWSAETRSRLTVIVEDLPLSQWAQDNGIPGTRHGRPFTLLPRYASRGEAPSVFVPGDTYAWEGLGAAGLEFAQSPLLFQGGNLMLVDDANANRRVLLIGEAEIWRNVSLGLTEAQVRAALAAECGADYVEVLPAVSYHIDQEVSCRAMNGEVVALVNDTARGRDEVLRAGFARLADRLDVARAGMLLVQGEADALVSMIGEAIRPEMATPSRADHSLAARFSDGPGDAGAPNFQRFMLASELLVALSEIPGPRLTHGHAQACFRSFARAENDRRQLREQLASLGWRVALIPGLADGERSLAATNGLQGPNSYIMPVWGGVFGALDDAAARAVQAALGASCRIQRIRTAESARRDGAVRCSAAVFWV